MRLRTVKIMLPHTFLLAAVLICLVCASISLRVFLSSSEAIILTVLDEESGEAVESNRLRPGIRVVLDNPNDSFWQDLIFNKEGELELSNQNQDQQAYQRDLAKLQKVSQI